MNLRQYQIDGRDFLAARNRALLLDAPGIGKTAQAISAWEKRGARTVLVICPPAVRFYWEAEIRKWSPRKRRIQVLVGTMCWVDELADIVICSYSLLQSPMVFDQLKERRWSVMCIDEVHFCKEPKAQRSKRILGKGGLIESSVMVWGLSGTLMPNRPIDLFNIMRSIGKEHIGKYKDWFVYTKFYCGRFKRAGRWDVSGAANLGDLRQKLFGTGLALRREKKEVLAELPRRTYRVIPVDGKIDEELDAKVEFDEDGVKTSSAIVELRQQVAKAKLPESIQYLQGLAEPVVVFTWHRDTTEKIAKALMAPMYYGGMSLAQKEHALTQFTTGKAQYFIANIDSAGTGLDGLQRRSSHCVFAEIPWTYCQITQATDRLWRMGQEQHVIADILLLNNTFETRMMKSVKQKKKVFHEIFQAGS